MNQRFLSSIFAAALAAITAPAFGQATQPAAKSETEKSAPAPATTYSGDLASRSTLTGDWGGVRNDLADKGMTFDLSVTQIYQGVTGGGQQRGPLGVPRVGSDDRDWQYSGNADFLFNLDTTKAGLWPGGYFTFEAEGNWGNDSNVNRQTGALLAANFNAIYLAPTDDSIAVSNVSYTQFVSEHLGFFVGKIATLTQTSGDMNDFAHGKGDSQFMNLAFNFNPTALITPYSTLGVGAVILPGAKPEDAIISLAVLDPNGEPNTAGFNTVVQDGTLFTAEARVKTNFFNHTGHQLVGGMYSDKLYNSLNQNFRIIVDNRQLAQTSGAWSLYYNFDQYLYQTASQTGKDQGWGVFGRFGVSDGDPNPVQYFWSLGLGGKGIIPARPIDGFGLGYYNLTSSNASVPAFIGLGDEWGVEAFYNIALTPWAQLTPDLQYIDGARPNSDSAWVMGVRLKLIF